MAEEKISSAGLLKVPGTQTTYYVKVDAVADTYSVIKATNQEFQNNEGTTLFQIKNASSLKSYTDIPTDNQGEGWNADLIEANGGATLLRATNNTAINNLQKARVDLVGDATLPPLQADTLLSGFGNTQTIAEGAAQFGSDLIDAFQGANRTVPGVVTPGTANRLIGGNDVLRYPIDMDTNEQDYLQIRIFSYKAGGLPTIATATNQGQTARQEQPREIIQIPIPNAIRDQNSVNWGAGNMTSTSGEAAQAVAGALLSEGGAAGAEGAAGALQDGFETGAALLGGLGSAGLNALKNKFIRRRFAANKLAGALGGLGINVDVNQAITRLGGVIENPNLELLFTGPALRTFQFTVRFTPRSAPESARVRQIIRALKERSAVKKGVSFGGFNETGDNLLLGTPDVFRLEYKKRGSVGTGLGNNIKGLNKFKTCALTNVSVDYTGEAGRWAAYDGDSQPVTTIVTLAFSELVPLYDSDYLTVSAEDDVAF